MTTLSIPAPSAKPSWQATNPNRTGGPKTAEGKAKSSANAVTHGLSAKKHVPPELVAAFQVEHARWRRHLGLAPIAIANANDANCINIDDIKKSVEDDEVALLAERLARICSTLNHVRLADEAARADRLRTARLDAEAAVRNHVLKLIEDMNRPGRAAGVVAAISDTVPGIDWLLQRWLYLETALERAGHWTADQLRLAQMLLDGTISGILIADTNAKAGGAGPGPINRPQHRDLLPPPMGPTTPLANDSRRELFSMMPLEPSRDRGPIDAITDPSKAQARATAALKAEAAHRIAWLRERREEIEPLHAASLEEAGLRALVGEGRGSSLGLLRLENSLDLALHRALKRIDALRKQGRISPPRSTQVPEPVKACTKCENEPQVGRPKAPAAASFATPAPSATTTNPVATAPRAIQPPRSSRSRRRNRGR